MKTVWDTPSKASTNLKLVLHSMFRMKSLPDNKKTWRSVARRCFSLLLVAETKEDGWNPRIFATQNINLLKGYPRVLNPFFRCCFMFFDYWRQQFIGERTRILDAWNTILLGELREPFQYFNYYSSELSILRSALVNIK